MTDYCCGFLFDPPSERVVLIRKLKPAWQAGKLNGVGGKVEPGETPVAAMRREFREEAAKDVMMWRPVATLFGDDWRVFFFVAWDTLDGVWSRTAEEVTIIPTAWVGTSTDILPNLKVLVPLAMGESSLSLPVVFHHDDSKD